MKVVLVYLGPKAGNLGSKLHLAVSPDGRTGHLPTEQGPFEFISAEQSATARALMLLRYPIEPRVTAVVEWTRIDPTHNMVRFSLQDYSGGFPPINLDHGVVSEAAPNEAALVREAERYYRPITSKPYASGLWRFLRTLQGEDYRDALRTFGRSAKRDEERKHRISFICTQFPKWQAEEATYEDAAEHCRKHNINVSANTLQHYMTRAPLKLQLSKDQGFVRDIFK